MDDDWPLLRTDLRKHDECRHVACLALDHCQWPESQSGAEAVGDLDPAVDLPPLT